MLFPTHILAGYVVGRRWSLPASWAVAGAALPDVVDKPIAMAGLSTLYHTAGHSLLVLVCVSAIGLAARRGLLPGERAWTALWVGWSSHLALDAAQMVVNGRPSDALFLAWPFVVHRPAVQLAPVDFLFHYLWTPAFFVEAALWAACGYVLWSAADLGPER